MIKGGSKVKKTTEKKEVKKVTKKVSLTVKVQAVPHKTRTRTTNTEIKSAHVFDKPEDIKKKNQLARKKLITWKKKKVDNGFIQPEIQTEKKKIIKEKEIVPEVKNVYEPVQKKQAVIITQRTEADKKIIMWSGIGFVMVIIFIIWIFQIKQTIIQARIEDDNNPKEDIGAIISDVTDKLGQMKGDLKKIKDYNVAVATSTVDAEKTLRVKMDDIIDDMASSTAQATSTMVATSTEADIEKLKEKLEAIKN